MLDLFSSFIGMLVDLGAFGNPAYFDNYFIEGAPFKNGLKGIVEVFLIAFFSFGGTGMLLLFSFDESNWQNWWA